MSTPARKPRRALKSTARRKKTAAPRDIPPAGPSAIPSDPTPAPALKYYRCPRVGHEQQDTEEFSFRLGSRFTGQVLHDTGPLCYRCLFDFVTDGREYDEGGPNWYGAMFAFLTDRFQTARVAPPEPGEVTPEEMAAAVAAAEQRELAAAGPDYIDPDGVGHRKCAEEGCTTFISGTCDPSELPTHCPDHADPAAGT